MGKEAKVKEKEKEERKEVSFLIHFLLIPVDAFPNLHFRYINTFERSSSRVLGP